MASKASASLALSLALNLLFFTLASACGYCPGVKPKPTPSPSTSGKCPMDTLKLGVCGSMLGGLISVEMGTPPKKPCCSLLEGLADGEAALCLCTALKANILGAEVNVPISLSLLVNYCGKTVPSDFQCA